MHKFKVNLVLTLFCIVTLNQTERTERILTFRGKQFRTDRLYKVDIDKD